MSSENQTIPTAKPAASAAPVISSWAMHLPPNLMDEISDSIDSHNPKNACPVHLKIAKDAAKAMLAALPPESRGAEVRMECTGAVGKQILIQVSPALVKK